MKRLLTTWALVVVVFGLAGVVDAARVAKVPSVGEFVSVSTTPNRLDLGPSLLGQAYEAPRALTVTVEANCAYGPLVLSTTELKRPGGGLIPAGNISVRSAATVGFVDMARPVAISRPWEGPNKIVLDLRVETGLNPPGGDYTGTMTITVMPPY